MNIKSKKHSLGVFSLVMINVIAVDSLRNLTAGAMYGFALVFFYILAALLFFIPTMLVTAELATGWSATGGAYVWVREAFGPRWGFFAVWLQWIYNVVWYPTIFSFMAGILAYLIEPQLINNKTFMLSTILITFWGATFVNWFGMRLSSFISAIGAIIGTILPMLLIAALGFVWIYLDKPMQIQFSWRNAFPTLTDMGNLAFLTNLLFALMGMEMSAVHAEEVRNPMRDFPRALLYSGFIILGTLIFASLAIAIVVSQKDLNLVSGLIEAFGIFFKAYHMDWFIPLIGICIIVGSLSGVSAWILGPPRALLVASKDNPLPKFWKRENQYHMPAGVLLTQGIIVTLLCTLFLVMPTINSSYWILSNLTAQLALLFYIVLFAAAIRLRYKHSHVARAYKIPGGLFGIWLVCGVGILTCIGAILIGFIPPAQMEVGKIHIYEMILISGIVICCVVPFLWLLLTKKKRGS